MHILNLLCVYFCAAYDVLEIVDQIDVVKNTTDLNRKLPDDANWIFNISNLFAAQHTRAIKTSHIKTDMTNHKLHKTYMYTQPSHQNHSKITPKNLHVLTKVRLFLFSKKMFTGSCFVTYKPVVWHTQVATQRKSISLHTHIDKGPRGCEEFHN